MIGLLDQMNEVDKEEAVEVTRNRHHFDSDDELDIDNLDL